MVGRSHHGPQFTRTAQFRAVLHALKFVDGPDAVEVVHQLAALERAGRVKRFIGCHIGKADGQGPHQRAYAGVEQMRCRHHAADFVAMGQRIDEHVGAGLAGCETVHIVHACIALAVGTEVTRQNFKDGRVVCHAVGFP